MNQKSNISVQDWLNYLYNEMQLIAKSESSTTPRILAGGSLLIFSILALFQKGYFLYLGIIGTVFSLLWIFSIIWLVKQCSDYLGRIDKLIISILIGQLKTSEEIYRIYKSIQILEHRRMLRRMKERRKPGAMENHKAGLSSK